MPTRCMAAACVCCYRAYDCEDIVFCCKGSGETLCCFGESCLATDEEPLGCGMLETNERNGECCLLGCTVCTFGLKQPSTFCASSNQCLCCYGAQALPFDEKHMPECACAYYFIACAPTCGCCAPPPDCPALGKVDSVPAIGVAAPRKATIERSAEPAHAQQSAVYTGAASTPVRTTVRHVPPPGTADTEQIYAQSAPAKTTTTTRVIPPEEELQIETAQAQWVVPPDHPSSAQPGSRDEEPYLENSGPGYNVSVPAASTTNEPYVEESYQWHSHSRPADTSGTLRSRGKPGRQAEDPDDSADAPPVSFSHSRAPGRHAEVPDEGHAYSDAPPDSLGHSRAPGRYAEDPDDSYAFSGSPVPPKRMVARHEPPLEDFEEWEPGPSQWHPRAESDGLEQPREVTRTTRRVIPPPKEIKSPRQTESISNQPSVGLAYSRPQSSAGNRTKVSSTVTTRVNVDGSVTVTKESFNASGAKTVQTSTYPNKQVAASYGVNLGGRS